MRKKIKKKSASNNVNKADNYKLVGCYVDEKGRSIEFSEGVNYVKSENGEVDKKQRLQELVDDSKLHSELIGELEKRIDKCVEMYFEDYSKFITTILVCIRRDASEDGYDIPYSMLLKALDLVSLISEYSDSDPDRELLGKHELPIEEICKTLSELNHGFMFGRSGEFLNRIIKEAEQIGIAA